MHTDVTTMRMMGKWGVQNLTICRVVTSLYIPIKLVTVTNIVLD